MSLELNVPEFENFYALVNSCVSFYEKNMDKINDKSIREKKNQLSTFIEQFHIESETMTSQVKEKILTLRHEKSLLLMTGHQPNLLPYSGVFRKITLIFLLEKELERRLGVQVVNFFGIADQDFTDDRWVKSSLLPAITRKNGVLNLNINLPPNIILKHAPKPSIDVINKWKVEIENWLKYATSSINTYCRDNGIQNWDSKEKLLYNNFEMVWKIFEEAYGQANNYSDLNAFFISKIVNKVWNYDTLFSRFSDCQRIFSHEFNFLLSHISDYSASLKKVIDLLPKNKYSRGVSEKEDEFIPFWYHCNCGSKARLSLYHQDNFATVRGICINCMKEYDIDIGNINNIDISAIASNISARAISMILIFSKGLGLLCYVGGIGGFEYLKEAEYVANKLNIEIPPIAIWRPHDKYLGISQLEAILEYKRITGHYEINKWENELESMKSRINNIYKKINILEEKKNKIINELKKGEMDMKTFKINLQKVVININKFKKTSKISILDHDLRILENVPIVLKLTPNIVDYAINIGLNNTSQQWINFLVNNGSFCSDIYLKSLLDDLTELKNVL